MYGLLGSLDMLLLLFLVLLATRLDVRVFVLEVVCQVVVVVRQGRPVRQYIREHGAVRLDEVDL